MAGRTEMRAIDAAPRIALPVLAGVRTGPTRSSPQPASFMRHPPTSRGIVLKPDEPVLETTADLF
ncbi:hypothetical protein ASF57_03290 [Methylobacterium sp. Leaf117]|nr:hypothetical protein ASF57_03290 [Methylobacterium sp. Leaf117]